MMQTVSKQKVRTLCAAYLFKFTNSVVGADVLSRIRRKHFGFLVRVEDLKKSILCQLILFLKIKGRHFAKPEQIFYNTTLVKCVGGTEREMCGGREEERMEKV